MSETKTDLYSVVQDTNKKMKRKDEVTFSSLKFDKKGKQDSMKFE